MLALTRLNGQNILLGEKGFRIGEHIIKIHVVKALDGKVKIGIEAPDGIQILREELVPGESKCESKQ